MTTLMELFLDVAQEVIHTLTARGERQLSDSVPGLNVVDRCRCGSEFCATVYTIPPPNGAWGDGLRNVQVDANEDIVILDVVDDQIACVEILDRNQVREQFLATYH